MNNEHESAEKPSFVILGAHRPVRFQAQNGNSRESQNTNKILDVPSAMERYQLPPATSQ